MTLCDGLCLYMLKSKLLQQGWSHFACKEWFHLLFHKEKVEDGSSVEKVPQYWLEPLYTPYSLTSVTFIRHTGKPRGSAFLSNIKVPIDGLILLGRFMNINLSQVSYYRSGLSSQAEELTVSYLEQNKGSWTTQNKEMETCQLTRTGYFVSASWRHTVHIQCEALSITEGIKMRGMLLTAACVKGE